MFVPLINKDTANFQMNNKYYGRIKSAYKVKHSTKTSLINVFEYVLTSLYEDNFVFLWFHLLVAFMFY